MKLRDAKRGRSEAGYTLLELLVVLSIIALLLTTASATFPRANALNSPYLASKSIEIALRQARTAAMVRGINADVLFDVSRRNWKSADGQVHSFPSDFELMLRTVRFVTTTGAINGIRFFSDGSASGGTVTIAHGPQVVSVNVDWLTGRIGIAGRD